MPKLRKPQYDSLDEVARDVERLRDSSYERGGSWNLAQTCDHLAKTVELGLRGGLEPQAPWIVRATVYRLLFDLVIATGWMPSGASAPEPLQPAEGGEEDPEPINRLLTLLAEARDRSEPIPPSPFVTGMHLEKWKKLQRVHAAHHLAFLRPTAPETGAAVT